LSGAFDRGATTAVSIPALASAMAVVRPAGPPPITTTSTLAGLRMPCTRMADEPRQPSNTWYRLPIVSRTAEGGDRAAMERPSPSLADVGRGVASFRVNGVGHGETEDTCRCLCPTAYP